MKEQYKTWRIKKKLLIPVLRLIDKDYSLFFDLFYHTHTHASAFRAPATAKRAVTYDGQKRPSGTQITGISSAHIESYSEMYQPSGFNRRTRNNSTDRWISASPVMMCSICPSSQPNDHKKYILIVLYFGFEQHFSPISTCCSVFQPLCHI